MKNLLKFTEIQTKITSLCTFVFTLLYMLYRKMPFRGYQLVVFFISMFLFDLTTTAINNYIDSKTNDQTFGYEKHTEKTIVFVLLGLSIMTGLYCAYLTDWVVLLFGIFCFTVGILYTYGPIPISRLPFGELVSGVMYGYVIPFLIIYINQPGYLMTLKLQGPELMLHVNLVETLWFLLIFSAPALLTASIMLANNTCDLEADIEQRRYTLVYYIGKKTAVVCMTLLISAVYLSYLFLVLTHQLPWPVLVVLVSAPKVYKNIFVYKQALEKSVSFGYIIQNFIMIMLSLSCGLLIGSII